ncbi:RuBisCO large subunit C-terminal-like domain-containing protein [uncultured Amnibacterium sp.]|uniref:RuBisCO large subunit C-terminal-like domain-containing protein n=1 Tax=uncultured Amnibacterium sp. TaxID=1631851 RepID=UPI0035CC8E48
MTVRAVYALTGDVRDARSRAEALAVEQSHEFPPDLAPVKAAPSRAHVVGLEERGPDLALATVEFPDDLAGDELTQLMVMVFGNCALLPGVRLVDLDVPAALAAAMGGGPALGVEGVRRALGVPDRPILATALKPVGLPTEDLAGLARQFAEGGIDLIKDDQGLGNQRWAPYAERVPRIAEAVAAGNAVSGHSARYLPCFDAPPELVEERLRIALDAGAGGLLVVPGVGGLPLLRWLARNTPDDFVLLAHPALLGSLAVSPTSGIAPGVLYGSLLRLAGADAAIFPSYGGRFSFTQDECRAIADGCAGPFAGLPASLPTPGGGMSPDRVPELVDFYGRDVVLLIGGELHRGGDPRGSSERFRALVESVV